MLKRGGTRKKKKTKNRDQNSEVTSLAGLISYSLPLDKHFRTILRLQWQDGCNTKVITPQFAICNARHEQKQLFGYEVVTYVEDGDLTLLHVSLTDEVLDKVHSCILLCILLVR